MKKNISKKIEKIVFQIYIALLILTFGLLIGMGFADKFVSLKGMIEYSIIGLYTGNTGRVICMVILTLVLVFFIVYWILQQRKVKSYTFGPLYLLTFFIMFLFAVGYYQYLTTSAFNKVAFTFLLIDAGVSFVFTTYGLIMFIINMVKDDKEE